MEEPSGSAPFCWLDTWLLGWHLIVVSHILSFVVQTMRLSHLALLHFIDQMLGHWVQHLIDALGNSLLHPTPCHILALCCCHHHWCSCFHCCGCHCCGCHHCGYHCCVAVAVIAVSVAISVAVIAVISVAVVVLTIAVGVAFSIIPLHISSLSSL